MLRFFRQLRQRLLAENRFSKYLLYAIGEIVLVVIGIFIALQLTNLNEQRKERTLEQTYLGRLYEDLKGDLTGFRSLQSIFFHKKKFLIELQENNSLDTTMNNPENWLDGLYSSRFISLPTVRSASFDELAGSGRLTLIRDLKLRTSLANYYAEYGLMSRLLEKPVGNYKQIVYEAFPGTLLIEWRTQGRLMDKRGLIRGYQALTDHPGLEAAVNAELSYTGDLLYYSSIFIDSVLTLQNRINQNLTNEFARKVVP